MLNIKNSNDKEFLILKNQNSIYKFFDTQNDHQKYTWSQDLFNYLNIISFGKLMIDEIQLSFNVDDKIINKLLRKNDYSVQTLYKISKLRYSNFFLNNKIDKQIIVNVIQHPTFSFIDRFFLKFILSQNILIYFLIKFLFITELYFLFFLPVVFIKRLFVKIKSLIK